MGGLICLRRGRQRQKRREKKGWKQWQTASLHELLLDLNLANCLIIKIILGLGCITLGFYFYFVGCGGSLLSLTATLTLRSNFICLLHSRALGRSPQCSQVPNRKESPQCGSNRAPKMHQLLASQVGNVQKKFFVRGLLGGFDC